jgi:hypothetical protein
MPFTVEQFYDVFRDYNEAVWPSQLLLIGLALTGVVLAIRSRSWSHAAVSGILAVLWVWLGIAYHLAFFARINPLAYAFSAISLFGAAVFVWDGLVHRRLRFEWRGTIRSWIGATLIAFGLVVYPAWLLAAGYTYPYMPTFGLPCPTTLYTVGMLALLVAPYPRKPHVVPILWSAVGVQAALFLETPQVLSLLGAGLTGIVLFLRNDRRATGTRGMVGGGG